MSKLTKGRKIVDLFRIIDVEKSDGLVSFGEMKGFLMLNGLKMNDDEIDKFMQNLDDD